jgi:hypothetical protein
LPVAFGQPAPTAGHSAIVHSGRARQVAPALVVRS